MSYSFRHGDADVQAGLRRIALSQIDTALREIGDDRLGTAKTVHQVRKRCKKLRGLIRFVRPHFDAYADENAAFRDAARELSALRDAGVVVATLDSLSECVRKKGAKRAFRVVRESLRSASEGTRADADAALRMKVFAGEMKRARKRVRTWSLDLSGHTLPGGLAKTYSRGHAAMERVAGDPAAEALHDWRKRVKYLWYHTRLMEEAAPELIGPHLALAKALSEVLGDHNDLAVLADQLVAAGDLDDAEAVALVLDAIRHRREALIAEAFRLGYLLYAEPPKAFERRMAAYWTQYWQRAEPSATLAAAE